jgi:flavin-dependent dehydrogenase
LVPNNEITIYGAGMSGLVAAINLAREGHTVLVRDREPGYGGSRLYNPSTHVTPLDPAITSEYIGIDITGAFHPVAACSAYFHDTKIMLPVYELFAVERGSRPTSLDTFLFDECGKLGVSFEFNSSLEKEELDRLQPDTVIACGLSPSVYEMLGIPYLRWYGWMSRGKIGIENCAWLWFDECITEYGYLSAVNGYYFNLLFSIREVGKECLDKYKRFMIRNEGIEHDNWQYVSGAVPLGSPDNPRLFSNNAILCGTISGAMDPLFWFGISGALVTGKVAAMAVSDPGLALSEFVRFTRRFRKAYVVKENIWNKFIRPNVGAIERLINTIGIERVESLGPLTESGRIPVPLAVPGFSHLSCY